MLCYLRYSSPICVLRCTMETCGEVIDLIPFQYGIDSEVRNNQGLRAIDLVRESCSDIGTLCGPIHFFGFVCKFIGGSCLHNQDILCFFFVSVVAIGTVRALRDMLSCRFIPLPDSHSFIVVLCRRFSAAELRRLSALRRCI